MKAFSQEFKLALSSLSRAGGFSATIISTLAITLGALICIFNLNHLLLVKELPYPDADKLIVMNQMYNTEGAGSSSGQTLPALLLWYKEQKQMSSMALVRYKSQSISDHREQPRVPVGYVTPEYFTLLGAPMRLGRGFSESEGFDQNVPVAVISHASWKKWFNSDDKIIGSTTQVGNTFYTIVGVTAEEFNEPQLYFSRDVEVWLTWDYQDLNIDQWDLKTGSLVAFGQLKPEIKLNQANAILTKQIDSIFQGIDSTVPGDSLSADLQTFKQAIVGDSQNIALLLMAGVSGLLLIAATNVTNLFLSRAAVKQRTMAIQAALGAKPSHLFTSMFAESLILCSAAALIGLVLAGWGFVLLRELASTQLPRLSELGVDGVTLLFTALITLLLSALFAKLSSRVVNYDNLKVQLQSSGKGSGLQVSDKTRKVLIISQVALASLLLIGAVNVLEKVLVTVLKPLGFNQDQVFDLRIEQGGGYEGREQLNLLTLEVEKQLLALPQVAKVARNWFSPIRGGRSRTDLNDVNQQRVGSYRINLVGAQFFDLLELPFLQGRTFKERLNFDQKFDEIILSKSLAQKLVPNGNAIGETFMTNYDTPLKVVGVVADYFNPNDLGSSPAARYYLPFIPNFHLGYTLKLKDNGNLQKHEVVSLLKQINPDIRVSIFRSLEDIHQGLIYRDKLAAGLAIALTLLTLILAAAGIYGVLNYSTQMRRYELGIHLSLGAKTERIILMVLKSSLTLVLLGLLLSIVTSALVYLLARQYLNEVIEFNLIALLSTFPVILITAFIACYLPVRKIVLDDPIKALRNE